MKKYTAISISLLWSATLLPIGHAVTTVSHDRYTTTLPETSASIERGGRVNAIDPVKGTITVDDADYRINPRTVLMHPSPRSGASSLSVMPIGSKIQFRTLRTAPSNQETVMEIWVVK